MKHTADQNRVGQDDCPFTLKAHGGAGSTKSSPNLWPCSSGFLLIMQKEISEDLQPTDMSNEVLFGL